MDVKVCDEVKLEVKPGDIIVTEEMRVYIITSQSVNGARDTLCGVSLDGQFWCMDANVLAHDGYAQVYSADEYELVLRKKEVK